MKADEHWEYMLMFLLGFVENAWSMEKVNKHFTKWWFVVIYHEYEVTNHRKKQIRVYLKSTQNNRDHEINSTNPKSTRFWEGKSGKTWKQVP